MVTKLRKIPSQFLVRASDREDARRATESIAIWSLPIVLVIEVDDPDRDAIGPAQLGP